MKFLSVTLFLSTAPVALAFAPPMLPHTARPSMHQGVRLSMVEEAVGSDVSIPYDAAARLAYDEWRAQYNKGTFDEERFANFKNNYETITVANVIAKKRARGSGGTVSVSLLTLNEFGDLSESEYERANRMASSPPTTTGDVLSKALEAAELQLQASNALGEAADALAEEEQVSYCCAGLRRIRN
jgi:Cathepsin propeptide inhibitor domain (I29)